MPRCVIPPARPNTIPRYPIAPSSRRKIPAPSPLNANAFINLLHDYPSPEFPQLLADIIRFGAQIGHSGTYNPVHHPNHLSAREEMDVIQKDIDADLQANRIMHLDALP